MVLEDLTCKIVKTGTVTLESGLKEEGWARACGILLSLGWHG